MTDLSLISPLYRSEPFIAELYRRLVEAARQITEDYEIVFVNDGSPDRSSELAKEIAAKDPKVRVIDLSRNFGHHVALFAATEAARGDLVFMIDSDLEEKPEWLLDFHRRLIEENADVVYGIQSEASGKSVSRLFYRVFNAISETQIPPHACTVRLMRRSYVDALTSMGDKKLFMAGVFMWVGFKQIAVTVQKTQRVAGRSSYGLARQMGLFVDALTSFSGRPLYLSFFLGSGLAAIAGLSGLYLIGRKLIFPETVLPGFTSLVVALAFVSGLNLVFLGVIGIYIAKIFAEVKRRPLYVVKNEAAQSPALAASRPENQHALIETGTQNG